MTSVQLFDTSQQIYWGVLLAFYLFYKGLSAGAFLLSSLGTVFGIEKFRKLAKVGAISALVFLGFAPLHLLFELQQPGRFLSLFYRVNVTSPISWGVYLLLLYAVALLIYAWYLFRQDMVQGLDKGGFKAGFYKFFLFGKQDLTHAAKEHDQRQIKFFGTVGVILALAVDLYTGFLLGVVQARAFWNTPLMPILLFASALVSGAAFLIIIFALVDKLKFGKLSDDSKSVISDLANLLKWFIVAEGALLIIYFMVLARSSEVGYAAGYFFLNNDAWSFLGLENGLGLLLPFLLLLGRKLRQNLSLVTVASNFIIIGTLTMRINLVIGGQKIPLTGNRLLEYTASGRDIGIIIGLGVAIIAVLAFLYAVLPMNRPGAEEKNSTKRTSSSKGVAM